MLPPTKVGGRCGGFAALKGIGGIAPRCATACDEHHLRARCCSSRDRFCARSAGSAGSMPCVAPRGQRQSTQSKPSMAQVAAVWVERV